MCFVLELVPVCGLVFRVAASIASQSFETLKQLKFMTPLLAVNSI